MSDLYLVLHRRLNSVQDWVELGTTVMKTARERLGLSYESVARAVPVSSKTYERYEKRGRVPRPLLPKIAAILQLEVEEPERVRVTLDGETATLPRDLRSQLEGAVDQLGQVGPQLVTAARQLSEALDAHEESQAQTRTLVAELLDELKAVAAERQHQRSE